MTIADGLVLLASTKEELRITLGMPKSAPFSTYVDSPLIPFTPRKLFSTGAQGVWYDPSNISTLFQDAAMTIPVTASGDPVGAIMDLSGNGNHATQSVSASRPTYQTDGILHWLAFDGVDDFINIPRNLTRKTMTIALGYKGPFLDKQFLLVDSFASKRYALVAVENSAISIHSADISTNFIKTDGLMLSTSINRGELYSALTTANSITSALTFADGWAASYGYGIYSGKSDYIGIKVLTSYILVDGIVDNTQLDAYVAKKSGVTL